jgi:hypothetical protein
VVAWTSSNPAGIQVSDSGLLVTRQRFANAVIHASSPDGRDSTVVWTGVAIAGLPATVRFAHAVRGAGPVTFTPSKGAPVTLSFGEYVDRPVTSGIFHTTISWAAAWNGATQEFAGAPTMVRSDDRLELYAINTPTGLFESREMILAETWGNGAQVPADSTLVRFIQSSPFLVFDVRPPGAPISGLPRHCYFDPGDISDFAPLEAGEFDLILKDKFPSPERARLRGTAPAGRTVTYVILGENGETAALLAFPDP